MAKLAEGAPAGKAAKNQQTQNILYKRIFTFLLTKSADFV